MTRLACRDDFMHFLITHCPMQFETMREYGRFAGISEQTLYSMDKRGIQSTDRMLELAIAFKIDTEVAHSYISSVILKRLSEKRPNKMAS